jgi:glyoxylase-like metal-dependent hydrolase (beta-lactamase superfamily II)
MKLLFWHSLILGIFISGCSASSKPTEQAQIGRSATYAEMTESLLSPGPLTVKKHTVANWRVPLSGLVNLEHPKARQAQLKDKDEPIQLYVYTVEHPNLGLFLIDSGVSTRFDKSEKNRDIAWVVEKAMKISTLEPLLSTQKLIQEKGDVAGVFLTHIHLDHIMGLTDLKKDTPIFTGPGEASSTQAIHAFSRGTTDRLLANVNALRELQFGESGILDLFGDGSFWAIHSPGHTPGTTAFIARAQDATHMMVGDVTHTRWGWDNNVEPGSYSKDGALNAQSLTKLKDIARDYPQIIVHPGHQN